MGRTYVFDCEKCGYRAVVSGGLAKGLEVVAQTISCIDCRSLRDVVIALKVPVDESPTTSGPPLEEVINRLQSHDRGPLRWDRFELVCAVDSDHKVREWHQPDKCPVCGAFLEPSGLPYAVWD